MVNSENYTYTVLDIARLVPPENGIKIGRVLHSLGSGKTLNNRSGFTLGDTCLHSTISSLRNDHKIPIQGKPEKFKGHDGHLSQRNLYWVEPLAATLKPIYLLLVLWGWRNLNNKAPAKNQAA